MIKTTGKEKNYELVEYVNDVNREHTEVLMELNINGIMDTAYSYGDQRLTNERFTDWTGYYTYDPRGSVTGVTDEEGMIWQSYRYDAFGSLNFGQPQYNNVYSYNAESYNPNVDAQYLRARYYSPTTADFISEDSYLGKLTDPLSLNRYNYVNSSPLNYVDPSGHKAKQYKTPQEVQDNLHSYTTGDGLESNPTTYPANPNAGKVSNSNSKGTGGIKNVVNWVAKLLYNQLPSAEESDSVIVLTLRDATFMVALATDNSEAAACIREEASKRMVSSLFGVAVEIESYLQRIGKNTSSNSMNMFSQMMAEKAIKEGIIDEEYYYYGRASVNHAVVSGGEGTSDTMSALLNAIGNMFNGGGNDAFTAGAFAASSMELGGGMSASGSYEVALEGAGYQGILYFMLGVTGAGALEAAGDTVNMSEKRREEENRRKAEEAAEKKSKGDSETGNSLKKVKNNKEANKVAKEFGYDGAEELKKDFVFKDGAKFNMMLDTETGEVVLVSIQDSSVQVHTGLFR